MKHAHLRSALIVIFLIVSVAMKAQNNSTPITIGEQIQYQSAVLNEDVTLYIHLPKNYSKENTYPVLYLLDGEYFFTQLVSTVDFLSDCMYVQKELIPKFIIVGIATKDRNKDFTPTLAVNQSGMKFPTGGGAETFLKFMKEELFPYIEDTYETQNKRLLTGWSLGGLFTTYCYLNHPDVFDYYLAVSPSLWWDDMVLTKQLKNLLSEKALTKKKFTMTIGALERNPMASSVKESFLPIISGAVDTTCFRFFEIEDESHSFSPLLAFHKGLQSIFYNWSIPDHLLAEKNFKELDKLIFDYAREFGFKGENLHGATYSLYIIALSQLNYDAAFKVAQFRSERFPESVYAQYNLGEMYYRLDDKASCLKYIGEALKIEKAKSEPNPDRLKQFEADLKEVSAEIEGVK